jgi:PTS system nitrogen regulatory IIA component
MHLSDVFNVEMVWPELTATTKEEVIRELANLISEREPSLKPDVLYTALAEREKLGSTGIEDGVAIPHAKVSGLDHVVVACGRSGSGLDFDAHDAKPTHLFFVLLAPMTATGTHLKVLARLSRLLKEARVRNKLLDAPEASELYRIIIEEDKKL